MSRDDPFDRVPTAIIVAVALIILLALLGLPTGWVGTLLSWILPGLVLGALATMLARRITDELPAQLATGTVIFALTIFIRMIFWLESQ